MSLVILVRFEHVSKWQKRKNTQLSPMNKLVIAKSKFIFPEMMILEPQFIYVNK